MTEPSETRAGISRRTVLRGAAVAGAAAAGSVLPAGTAGAAPGPGGHGTEGSFRADLILHNGRIHTMDDRNRVVSVVAVSEGRIVYAGNNVKTARHGFEDKPRMIDLRGRTAIPGIIDCHNHVVLMGNRPGHHTPLENAYSIADVQATYRARARGVGDAQFITTIGGFHPNQFREHRLPTLAELDAALPETPAYISVGFSGPSVTNSAGAAWFAANAELPPAVGADGSIAAGAETGKATLALRRTLTFDDRKRSVLDAMAYATSVGVTTHLDQGAFQATNTPADGAAHEDNYSMHLPFLAVYDEGRGTIRLRINFLHMDTDPDVPTLQQRLRNAFKFFGGDMVRTGGIGEFIAASYSGGPVFVEAARRIARARWRTEVHSLTSTDFQTQIQGFEQVDQEIGIKDLRWVVAHVPRITEDYLDRLKAIGGGVNLTGWQYLAGTGPQSGPPFRTIVDNGIPAGMSSDGMQIAPMNPFVHAYYATTGLNALGNQINPAQQISRQELMELYTRANQWFLGDKDEGLLGSLEVGRLGDVVVLSDDYFTVPVDRLRKVRSVLTVVGGEVVHDTGAVH
jgi:predicted amidohydrolase YtcJ